MGASLCAQTGHPKPPSLVLGSAMSYFGGVGVGGKEIVGCGMEMMPFMAWWLNLGSQPCHSTLPEYCVG